MAKVPLTAIKNAWESLTMRSVKANMAEQRIINKRTTHRIAISIGAGANLSITAMLNFVRIIFLLSPFILSLPQVAKASEASAYTIVDDSGFDTATPGTARPQVIAQFGPFMMVSATEAELNGATDEATPGQFRQMLIQYPALKRINMIDCAGTENDDANLEVARMIRRAGINTHVPADGSIRSGGVELFLAGAHRSYDKGAQFGVHSWIDEDGHQAGDVPADDPINQAYIKYYQEVGLPLQTARAFYAFTNQTAFDAIHYMTEQELAQFNLIN
jgi:hypothetical protein